MSQGVKEGLVAHPADWPGATSVPALIGPMQLEGTWIDRDLETRARRAVRAASRRPFESRAVVPLAPFPLLPVLDFAFAVPVDASFVPSVGSAASFLALGFAGVPDLPSVLGSSAFFFGFTFGFGSAVAVRLGGSREAIFFGTG